MGPKNPHAGMPPRNLPDKPGSFANAWEDSCPMKWKFGPKTCLKVATRLMRIFFEVYISGIDCTQIELANFKWYPSKDSFAYQTN